MRLFDLNDPQLRAVKQTQGPVLILAGAGTGKTRTITARIAYLISEGVPPEHILAVTFTNKAADEMRERVAHAVAPEKAKLVTVSTFHALCVRILRQDIEKLGYKGNFTIYDQSDATGLIRQIIHRVAAKDEKLEPSVAQNAISKAKNLGVDAPSSDAETETLAGAVFARYQRELKRLNAVDFDDLLLLAVKVLRDHDDVRAKWRGRYHYLMVDEFQDTNRLQLDLVRHLAAGEPPNVCVVGDDDQSIYGWRGADVSNILEFERHFPRPTVVALEQNYRSTGHILDLANSLIRHNPRRRAKRLWSAEGEGKKPQLVGAPDDREEALYAVQELHRIGHDFAVPWKQFAVLFRTNAQSRLIEEALRERNIPYRIVGGKSFFDRREIKDVLAYLSLLLNTADDVSLLRVIQAPPRGIGEATVERALDFSIEHKCGLLAALQHPDFHGVLAKKTREAIKTFVAFLDRFETRMFEPLAKYADVTKELLNESGYLEDLKRGCKDEAEFDRRSEAIHELLLDLERHQEKSRNNGLREFLDKLSLDREKDEDDKEKDAKDGVTLITLHAAKGLEFDYVYVLGLEEGLLPHERSKNEGTLDEERRLLYVAITRARKQLTLLYCRGRLRYGQVLPRQASSFIRELDTRHYETVNWHQQVNAPVEESAGLSAFARMKAMLGG
ncbi:MAG: UvrD-helicase domain-containing protein [Verrucomicrobia bacterium]|nr:UvrD-helicase domain-containing protein [Verrucomicrobiota bacterium]